MSSIVTDPLFDGIAERIKEATDNGGFWRTCSGCYECEDGQPNGFYPHSKLLGCTLGGGCGECGGLGAIFDDTDYEAMAADMIAEMQAEDATRSIGAALQSAGVTVPLRAGHDGEMLDANGNCQIVVDPNRELSDDHVNIIAKALACAVNKSARESMA